jgi:DNA-directed RNA polymerase specialized sigma24 family protein
MTGHSAAFRSANTTLVAAREMMNSATQNARLVTLKAAADGVSEVDIAKGLGVSRMTVRKWLGK